MIDYTDSGIWVTDDQTCHAFDESLADSIAKVYKTESFKSVIANPYFIDFGCGTGAYSKKLSSLGIESTAIDGNPKSSSISLYPIRIEDLTRTYDHAPVPFGLCIEVGNHIPAHLCDSFLDNMCSKIENMLIMSWAKPGQNGNNQLNRLDYDSVAALMYKRGFLPDHEATYKIRRAANYFWLKDTTTAYKRFSG